MKNKTIIIIIASLSFIVITLSALLFYNIKKINTPYLKTITLFGTEITILPNVYTYRIDATKNTIKNTPQHGCESPFTYVVNKMYKRIDTKKAQMDGIQYIVNGEDYSYFFMDFIKYDTKKGIRTKTYATYYFEVFFDKPLQIDEACRETDIK